MPLLLATDDELDAVAALVNASYRGEGGWTHEMGVVIGERTNAQDLRRDLAAQIGAALLVWRDEVGGPILGCVWLEPADADAWYLGLLTVRPDLQDRKLGRVILAEAEAYAFARGARRIKMTVVNVRASLIAWYERRGYRLTGESLPFPYDDGRFGAPVRGDLAFVVLARPLQQRVVDPPA